MNGHEKPGSAIASRYQEVLDRVETACRRVRRDPASVRVIAVSKTKPLETVEAAWQAGIREFGENRAQELIDKADKARSDIRWHFIGHLQTNKVKQVVGRAALIHSVDSERLAVTINEEAARRGMVQQVLLQVNISEEGTKSGFGLKDLPDMLLNISGMEALKISGLMTIAPLTEDAEEIRRVFAALRELRDGLRGLPKGLDLELLSMGMTNDFEIAVEEGADLLRIGTAIFGHRG